MRAVRALVLTLLVAACGNTAKNRGEHRSREQHGSARVGEDVFAVVAGASMQAQ